MTMHTVRTSISASNKKLFRTFLDYSEMEYVAIGDYVPPIGRYADSNTRYICYAYSDADTKAVANMTFIKLKYGSVEQAYQEYIHNVMNQNMNETYYTRAP